MAQAVAEVANPLLNDVQYCDVVAAAAARLVTHASAHSVSAAAVLRELTNAARLRGLDNPTLCRVQGALPVLAAAWVLGGGLAAAVCDPAAARSVAALPDVLAHCLPAAAAAGAVLDDGSRTPATDDDARRRLAGGRGNYVTRATVEGVLLPVPYFRRLADAAVAAAATHPIDEIAPLLVAASRTHGETRWAGVLVASAAAQRVTCSAALFALYDASDARGRLAHAVLSAATRAVVRGPVPFATRLAAMLTDLLGAPAARLSGVLSEWCDTLLPSRAMPSAVARGVLEYLAPAGSPAVTTAPAFEAATHFTAACTAWAAPVYVTATDTLVQASFSRALVSWIAAAPVAALDFTAPAFLALTTGVQLRLESSSRLIRACGLAVAQAFSLRQQPLFAAAAAAAAPGEGGDAGMPLALAHASPLDFSTDPDSALLAETDNDIDAGEALAAALDAAAAAAAAVAEDDVVIAPPPVVAPPPPPVVVTPPVATTTDDGDMVPVPTISIAGYVYNGHAVAPAPRAGAGVLIATTVDAADQPLVIAARKLAALAPLSLAAAVDGLTRTDTGGGGAGGANALPVPGDDVGLDAPPASQLHIAALCSMPTLVRAAAASPLHRASLADGAPSALRVLLALEDRYGLPDYAMYRHAALVALVVTAAPVAAPALVATFTGPEQSEGSRLEILDVLVAAAQELAGAAPAVVPDTPWELAERVVAAPAAAAGAASCAVVVSPSRRAAPPSPRGAAGANTFAALALPYFFAPLLRGIVGAVAASTTAGADGTELASDVAAALSIASNMTLAAAPRLLRDAGAAALLAQAVRALAAFLAAVRGDAAVAPVMLSALLPLTWVLREHASPAVRGAVLAAHSAALGALATTRSLLTRASVLGAVQRASLIGTAPPPPPAYVLGVDASGDGRPVLPAGAPPSTAAPRHHYVSPGAGGDSDDEGDDTSDIGGVLGAPRGGGSSARGVLAHLTGVGAQLAAAEAVGAATGGAVDAGTATDAVIARDVKARLGLMAATPPPRPVNDADAGWAVLEASLAGRTTLWDDVVAMVAHAQAVADGDADAECRGVARALCGNPLVAALVAAPLAVLEAGAGVS